MKYVDGYTDLANAIIKQAVKDYQRTYRRLRKAPNSKYAKEDIEELESFFFSDWFGVLSDLDATYLLKKVKERVEEEEAEWT